MKKLTKYFFQGLVFVAPVALTLYVIYAVISTIDGWLGLGVPGLGVVITVAVITGVGFLASHFLMASLLGLVDRVMDRLPFIKILYSSLRDLLSAVVGDKKRFDKPVLVTLAPGGTTKALGFITRESLNHLGIEGHVAVYFPQSYNFAGQLAIIPRDQVKPLDVASADVMTFIVSAGVAGDAGTEGEGRQGSASP